MVGTSFTYQGRLELDGSAVNDTCDFQVSLWDAVNAGTHIGSIQAKTNVAVSDGYFTVQLDFGGGAFNGEARWLAIAVRCPADSGSYTDLTPRQALTAAPYALALPGLWTQITGASPNLIGGYNGKTVGNNVIGEGIGGGGEKGEGEKMGAGFWTHSGGGGKKGRGLVGGDWGGGKE